MDLNEPGMLELLVEQDEREWRAHKAKWMTIAVPFVIPLFFLFVSFEFGMLYAGILTTMAGVMLGQFLGELFKFKARPIHKKKT